MQPAPIATAHQDPAAISSPGPAVQPLPAAPSEAPPPIVTAAPHPAIQFPVLGKFYPRQALRAKVEGQVLATCAVTMAGGLTECVINKEEPAGYGFGRATLKALEQTQVQVILRNGLQIPTVLRIPIDWRLPHGSPAASPPDSAAAPPAER